MENRQLFRIGNLQPADFDEVTQVWEASVRATHHFLSEADIAYFRPLIRNEFLPQVQLHGVRGNRGRLLGFLGTSADKIEMLFVLPDFMGKGIGKALLNFAANEQGKRLVDVNEQNPNAVTFYRHSGFVEVSRSETDSLGKPFPILHLELQKIRTA